jgi:hypothetical protein
MIFEKAAHPASDDAPLFGLRAEEQPVFEDANRLKGASNFQAIERWFTAIINPWPLLPDPVGARSNAEWLHTKAREALESLLTIERLAKAVSAVNCFELQSNYFAWRADELEKLDQRIEQDRKPLSFYGARKWNTTKLLAA